MSDDRAPAPAPAPPPHRRPFDLAIAGIAAVVSLVLTVPVLRLWRADLGIPFAYSGDANSHGMLFKAVLDHGWYERNPNLAAPYVQRFNDFPMPDNLHLAVAKVMDVAFDSYGAVLNLYFLAGFGLSAFFAALVLRLIGLSRGVALVLAVLYAFAPYHFIRGEAQLFLASYYAVPLGILMALGALGHVDLFPRRAESSGWRSYVTWRAATTLGMCVLVGSSSAYYGAFAVILVAVATLGQGVGSRDRRALVVGGLVATAITLTVAANVAPDLLWARSHGSNSEAVYRAPGDTETYSLKLTQLLLPSPHHRIDALASISQRYLRDFPIPSEPHPLGAAAAAGVVYLVGLAGVTLLRGRPRTDHLPLHLAVLTVASLLAAMTGGLASLFELVFIPILRGWNRIAIFIAFLGLAGVGLLLDGLRSRWLHRRPLAFAGVLLAVLGLGLLDQTSPAFVPDYPGIRTAFQADADFVERIEQALPAGGMVFQLPYVEFPEAGPRYGMVDYDHFRGYLHSDTLRWSYGGMKGRIEADWAASVAAAPPADALPRLAAVGFDGIYIDRAGYADQGAAVEAGITAVLGEAPQVSRNGRLSFFDLTDHRGDLLAGADAAQVRALRRDALTPVQVSFGAGFYEGEQQGESSWHWAGPTSVIELDNTASTRRTVEVAFEVATGTPAPSTLTLTLPGAGPEAVAVSSAPVSVTRVIDLPPGVSRIELSVDSPAAGPPGELRDLRLQVLDFRVSTAVTARG